MNSRCVDCGEEFTKTGQNHKRCSACKKIDSKSRTRKASWEYAVRTGRIKQAGIGSGNARKGSEHQSYTTGIGIFTRYRKDVCERCASDRFLCAHHRDRDRTNNVESNIETLCKSCHQKEHEVHHNFRGGNK